MTATATAGEIVEKVQGGFELVEEGPGRYLVQFPFVFRSGDFVPVVLERRGDSWRLTDDSLLSLELGLCTRKDFLRGRLGEQVERAAAAHGLTVENGNFVCRLSEDELTWRSLSSSQDS